MPPADPEGLTLLQAIVLGIVQGLTEFLPVSSTAHLVLVEAALGWKAGFPFNVLVQWGTLVAVVAYFRADLASVARGTLAGLRTGNALGTPEARLGWWIALGTVPIVLAGLALHDTIETIQENPRAVAWILLFATSILFIGERWGRRRRAMSEMRAVDAVLVGLSQCVALLPGVSRSAATITGGMLVGLDRAEAARFSFLLSIPALLAAGIFATWGLARGPVQGTGWTAIAVGFLAAAVVGYLSIAWLLRYLARHPLGVFAWYRIAVALLLLWLL
jgi:undecaprenyl-diphosphatase